MCVELSTKADSVCNKLEHQGTKESNMMLKSIERVAYQLKQNTHFGDPISKRLIPKLYKQHGVKNLFRIELPCYWRLLYTLRRENDKPLVFILDILNHKEYNKLFNY